MMFSKNLFVIATAFVAVANAQSNVDIKFRIDADDQDTTHCDHKLGSHHDAMTAGQVVSDTFIQCLVDEGYNMDGLEYSVCMGETPARRNLRDDPMEAAREDALRVLQGVQEAGQGHRQLGSICEDVCENYSCFDDDEMSKCDACMTLGCGKVWGCFGNCRCDHLACNRRRKLSEGGELLLEGELLPGRQLKNVNSVRAKCQTALKAAAKILNNNFDNQCVGTFSKIKLLAYN